MVWLVVIVIALVVIGSVMWLKPSARDQRLAVLRLDAIKRGLQVSQFTFKPDSAKNGVRDPVMATSYTLLNPAARGKGELVYRVAGQSGWDTEGLPEGCSWHDKGSAADAAKITAALAMLTDDVLLLEVFTNRVTLMAAEHKTATAENYEAVLKALLPA
tara:strand:- start:588 stop:1064 length:477 start_codon:yes stop_codon:yes gene_type:complete